MRAVSRTRGATGSCAGSTGHEFDVYALSRSERPGGARPVRTAAARRPVRTAPLWGTAPPGTAGRRGAGHGRTARTAPLRRVLRRLLAASRPVPPGRPGRGRAAGAAMLPGTRRDQQGGPFRQRSVRPRRTRPRRRRPDALLRSEAAVRILESACRAPGALRAAHGRAGRRPAHRHRPAGTRAAAAVPRLVRRPDGHAGSARSTCATPPPAAPAALPGLLARHFFGTPLLVTEYGVRLREHYLARARRRRR